MSVIRRERVGNLEYRYYDSTDNPRVRLVRCPACGERFGERQQPGAHVLREHGPEDFGLPP